MNKIQGITAAGLLLFSCILSGRTQLNYDTLKYDSSPQDQIQIKEVNLLNSDELKIGSIVEGIGTYELESTDKALLGLSITSSEKGGKHCPEAYESQEMANGSGSFRLLREIDRHGSFHLSVYPETQMGHYGQSTTRLYFLELK
ncbi:hypothetical protein GCM10007047_07250 [Cerasicoccus arenae]|uniref:Lipoprotein n=2 Tax=Cerasicoccus arenae TaxID=424488 RepID=A0A8J3D9P0_9BACT|nr:hypothetical protein GCM10007047_07250 [Cerasicoccus arenae]